MIPLMVKYQLELLEQLSQFDFGRYLLQNQGINGYWSHYMLTYPWEGRQTGKNNRGEWNTSLMNQEDLLLQRILLVDIIEGKWQCYCSSEQIQMQLKSSGFRDIEFIYDAAKLFPTVVAFK